MSSWERSRYIPWDRIPRGDGAELEKAKERIFRDLQRQTVEEELREQERPMETPSTGDVKRQKIPFSSMELLRQAAFGGCIGSITGSVFGFMDGMRSVGEQPLLVNASNSAKGRFLFQGVTRSATVFGLFFSGFQVLKYGVRVAADPGEFLEIGVASAGALGALMIRPEYRMFMPYGFMLIGMDSFNVVMKKFS